jgi:hypothetical protein
MSAVEPARQKLRQAIDSLRTDIDRVEFWADALDRLSQPIPEYPATDRLSQHLLPSQRRLVGQH